MPTHGAPYNYILFSNTPWDLFACNDAEWNAWVPFLLVCWEVWFGLIPWWIWWLPGGFFRQRGSHQAGEQFLSSWHQYFFPYISKGNHVQLRKEMIRRVFMRRIARQSFFEQDTILVPGLPTCHIFKEEEHSYYILCRLYYSYIKQKNGCWKKPWFSLGFSCTAEGSRDDPVWCCFRCRCRVPGQELSWIWTFWVIYPFLGSSPFGQYKENIKQPVGLLRTVGNSQCSNYFFSPRARQSKSYWIWCWLAATVGGDL